MLLADIIENFAEEGAAVEAVLRLGDLPLLSRLNSAADRNGVSLADYAGWAVRAYADGAPHDEWTTLMGILGRAEDPGVAYLSRALTYVLDHTAEPDHETEIGE